MGELRLVTFTLDGQQFGAEASQIYQIIKYQSVTKVPKMPDFLEGMIEYRGSVVPVISLNKRFSMKEPESLNQSKILLTLIENKLTGFVVDEVSEITGIPEADVSPMPMTFVSEATSYLTKVAKKNDQIITVVDLARILDSNEIKCLDMSE